MTIEDVRVSVGEMRRNVAHLNEDYADTLDSLDLDAWCEFFTEDALYKVVSRDTYEKGLTHGTIYCDGIGMIRDRALVIRETTVKADRALKHFVSSPQIRAIDGNVVRATARFLVIESMYDQEPQISLVGRYVDKIVIQDDGQLKYSERVCVYDNWRVRTTLLYPV